MTIRPLPPHHARRAFTEGVRALLPILIGVMPFGLIFGVTAAELPVDNVLGWASSFIIFAGASQLAAVDLLADNAAPAVVILTVLVINARHLMYSASLEAHFRDFPVRDKVLLPYLLTDQAYAMSILRFDDADLDPTYRKWYFLGAGLALWTTWQLSTTVGIVVGDVIPDAWRLEFAVPLVFLALLVPSVRTRPAFVAAAVAAAIAVAGRIANGGEGLPLNLGLILGALAGVVAGTLADREELA